MLTDIKIPDSYFTTTSERLIKELYIPALRECSLYQRGVAFFSIKLLMLLLDEVVDFVAKGGIIHLVTSVELDSETVESFSRGYLLSSEDVERRLLESIQKYMDDGMKDVPSEQAKMDVIANMIASKHLVIKVAYVPNGIYHEKIGVFTDAKGNAISLIGSANATVSAYKNNFETVNIFASWKEYNVVQKHRVHFTQLWSDCLNGVTVMQFPEAVEKEIVSGFKHSANLKEAIDRLRGMNATGDGNVGISKLRDYQLRAIEEFEQYDYAHFFEMATGTGKTFTAIKAIERMAEKHSKLNVVILVPLTDLQEQWAEAIRKDYAGQKSIFFFGGNHSSNITHYNFYTSSNDEPCAAFAICVYDTFFGQIAKDICPVGEDPMLIVVDEAHNLTPGNVATLQNIDTKYRLGLSATPTRFLESETKKLLNYFLGGRETYKFGLEKAIEGGFLSKYEYYPLPVELTADESDDYRKITERIGAAAKIYENDPSEENQKKLDSLRMKRSRVVKKAVKKLDLLRTMISDENYDFTNSVVFCGPGDLSDGSGKILDCVVKIISESHVREYYPARYTSGEDDRGKRLEYFKDGLINVLVAIKCFDEGVDVPALDKIYIMASDCSLRQTIQRRGRVLRISKQTGKEIARIYDFVVGTKSGRTFIPLDTENPRVAEYSRLSINPESSDMFLRTYAVANELAQREFLLNDE